MGGGDDEARAGYALGGGHVDQESGRTGLHLDDKLGPRGRHGVRTDWGSGQ